MSKMRTAYANCILEFQYDDEIPEEDIVPGLADFLSDFFTVHMLSVQFEDDE